MHAIPFLFIGVVVVGTVIACILSKDVRAMVVRLLPALVQRLLGRVGL